MKEIIVNSNKFSDFKGFTQAISSQLGDNGRDYGLDALDDILYGGVVGIEEGEHVGFIWVNAKKGKEDSNNDRMFAMGLNEGGMSLYDIVVDIIRDHDNVTLHLR